MDLSVVLKEAVSEVCAARGFPSAQARTETVPVLMGLWHDGTVPRAANRLLLVSVHT